MSDGPRAPRAGWLAIASLGAGAANYVFAVALTHRLPPREYAVFAATQTLLVLNGLVGSAGIPWVLAREIARSAGDAVAERAAITFAFWGNVAFGLAFGVAAGGIAAAFASATVVVEVVVSCWLVSVASTGLAVLQGRGHTGRLAALFIAETIVKLAVGLLLVHTHRSAAAAVLGSVAGAVVLFGSFSELWGRVGVPRGLGVDRELWRSAVRLGRLQVGVGLVSSVDTVAAAVLSLSPTTAATYQAAAALGRIPTFFSNAIALASFPSLVLPDEARRARVRALSTYGLVGIYVGIVLSTAPPSVLALVFPASFGGIAHFLPYTAALGIGLGTLNVLATFAQSRARTLPTGWTLLIGLAAVVVAVSVGEALDGARGLVVGALVAVWLTAAAVIAEPAERGAVRGVLNRTTAVHFAVLLGVGVLLATLSGELPWIAAVGVSGLVVLVLAFPELAGGRLSGDDRRQLPAVEQRARPHQEEGRQVQGDGVTQRGA